MDRTRLAEHRLRNIAQSVFLIGSMILIMALVGWMVGGWLFMLLASVSGLLLYLLGTSVSTGVILRMYRMKPVTVQQAPRLYELLQLIVDRAAIEKTPVIYYTPSRLLNAFSMQTRDQNVICVSDGLLRNMNYRELAGVLAHEVAHIMHRDIRVMSFADITMRMTVLLSLLGQVLLLINLPLLLFGKVTISWWLILVLILAPRMSALLQLALSRTREYDADMGAAKLLGDPEPLAEALARTEYIQGRVIEQILFPGRRVPEPSIIRTHPETGERIRRLRELVPDTPAILGPEHQHPPHEGAGANDKPAPPRRRLHGLWF